MRPKWPHTSRPARGSAATPHGAPEGVPPGSGARRLDRTLAGWRRLPEHADTPPPEAVPAAGESELERAAHEYRHVREEHRRAASGSRVRRRLGVRLRETRRRFERLAASSSPARTEPLPAPTVSIRGAVPHRARERLARVLADASDRAPRQVTGLRASLTRHADPAATEPVEARATITLPGRDVHARASAATEDEAIHLLETRLRRALDDLGGRTLSGRR